MKLFHKPWFIGFAYLLLVKPGCVTGMPALAVLDSLINILRIVLLVGVVFAFLTSTHKVNRMLGILGIALVSIVWEVIATYIAGADVAEWGSLFNAMGITLFTYMAISINYDAFLEGASIILGIYVIANLITVVAFPNGMYASALYAENYFLSYRTAWFAVYLFAFTVCLLRVERLKDKFSKIWSIIVVVCGYVSMVRVWTATGLFCFTLAGIMLIIWKVNKRRPPMKILHLMFLEGVIFYVLIIAQMMQKFEFIIVGILNKDLTMTSRTRIWSRAINKIMDNFLTGIGRLETEQMKAILGYGASHPHNRYLYTILCFGIVGLFLFLALIYFANNKRVPMEKIGQKAIIMAAFVAYLTAGQVESLATTGAYIYPLYLIASSLHLKDINSRGDNDVNRIGNAVFNE